MVVRPSVSRSRVETERVGASMPPRFVRPNYVNSRCTCLGTEADLTAALRKSLAAGVAVDSPLATIVTAFVVIFSEKECSNAGRNKLLHLQLTLQSLIPPSSSFSPASSKSVLGPSGAEGHGTRGRWATMQ